MRIRMVVTLDVDPEVWASTFGIEPTSRAVRDDVLMHLRDTVHEHYVADLGIARDSRVIVESSHRNARLFQ